MIALMICGVVLWLIGITVVLALCKAAARADRAIELLKRLISS